MDKKMGIILLLFACFFGVFYYMINNNDNKDYDNKSNVQSNVNDTKEEINSINDIKLYVTDFKYNDTINGYVYTEVALSDEIKSTLKTKLLDIDLNSKVNATVYGKYKLVIDNRTIYFDPDNDYALYINKNQEIKFSNELKKQFINSEKLCSCCMNNNCELNLCNCNN